MTTSQLDDAFDAYLAGRPVPDEAAPLVEFADAVREMSSRPGRPSAGLVELLATGLLTGAADVPAAPVPPLREAATALPARRTGRSRMFTVLAAAIAKFASAGAVAHATAGVGVALVTVSSAGAAGVLPSSVQDGVATTIEAVTPFDFPDSTDEIVEEPVVEEPVAEEPVTEETDVDEPVVEEPVTEETDVEKPVTEDPATDVVEQPANFGATVSEDAKDGGVDGAQISQQARDAHQPEHARGPAKKAERPVTQPAPEVGTAPAPEEPQAEQEHSQTAPAEEPAEVPAAGKPQGGAGRP